MQRGNYPPNPYNNRGPFPAGNQGFLSPPMNFIRSPPAGARFHQQFVPHHSSARWQSPNNSQMKSPRGMNSPYQSPHNSFEAKTPGSHSSGRNNSFNSNSSNSFSWSTPNDVRGQGMHRGRFTPGGSQSSWNSRNFTSPRNDPNSNPGGSSDISVYYNPDMVKDPWANLKPIPAKKTSFRST